MDLNSTPQSERIHISIFGRRNAGKSSIINALTNQNISIVSDIKGTTTDPVKKAMEILPLGAVLITDTAGLDDKSNLGKLRVQKTIDILNKTDIAILAVDSTVGFEEIEADILDIIKSKNIPYIVAVNKVDIKNLEIEDKNAVKISALNNIGIDNLIEAISNINLNFNKKYIVRDLLCPSDTVVLVIPIDESAPKGRLILPQQQTIRDILESDATAIVTKETQLNTTLHKLSQKPKLVITDSQIFKQVASIIPDDILLTSFSILFARYKGELDELVKGANFIDNLKEGDKILIAEGCTHHRQCNDIGTVKIPKWIEKYTHKRFIYETSSGFEYPQNLSQYKLIVHCGGCILNQKEMNYRINCAKQHNIPIVNYGILIAYLNGILDRSLEFIKLTK